MNDEVEEFNVVVSEFGKYRILSFGKNGEIDLFSAAEINEEFKNGNDAGIDDWAIDLTSITHIDSSGLGSFVTQTMILRKKGKLLFLINPNKRVMHLLSMPGIGKLFSIVTDKSMLPE